MLMCKDVSISRNGKQIISRVSFVVVDGELFVITGPNGVGKSTLLHAIAGIQDKDVEILGAITDEQGSFAQLSPDVRFRRGVMLTFQEPPVLPGVTFLTVAREMLFAKTGERLEIAEMYRKIREVFGRVGLSESFIEKSLFDGFSGGEKKRAELALVLLARPRILLLDEIDAGLDAAGRDVAREAIRELLASGSSIVCVTHSPDFLASFSEKQTLSLSLYDGF